MGANHSRIQRQQTESGSAIVLAAVGMAAFLAFAALSIDLSHVYQQQRDIQSATDAGALAAAALITNPPPADSVIIQEAVDLANANGVTTSEIGASNFGTIELGQWTGLAFSAGTKPYNAVRVPAQRTVGLFFGPVVGLRQKVTAVHSVAVNGIKTSSFGGNGIGVIPFGLDVHMLDLPIGSIVTVDKSLLGPGNFGELDLGGSSWGDNMVNGCNCTESIGNQVGTIQGQNGSCQNCISTGFANRLAADPFAVMPVIGTWPSGNSGPATIVGFVGVKLLTVTGPGTWSVTFQIVPIDLGGGGGITTNTFYGPRVLVQ